MDAFCQKILYSGAFIVSVDYGVIETVVIFSIFPNWSAGYNQCHTPLTQDETDILEDMGVSPGKVNFHAHEWLDMFCFVVPQCVRRIVKQLEKSKDGGPTNKSIAKSMSPEFSNFYLSCWCKTLDEEEEALVEKVDALTIQDIERMDSKHEKGKEQARFMRAQQLRREELQLEPIEFWMLLFCIYQLKDEQHEEYLQCVTRGTLLFSEKVMQRMDAWRTTQFEKKEGHMDLEFMVAIMLYNQYL